MALPVIVGVDTLLLNGSYRDVWAALQPAMLIALETALPIWLIFYLLTRYVNNERFFYLNKKLILSSAGAFLIFLPQLVALFLNSGYFISYSVVDLVQPLTHALILTAAVCLLKLNPAEEPSLFYGDYKESPES